MLAATVVVAATAVAAAPAMADALSAIRSAFLPCPDSVRVMQDG